MIRSVSIARFRGFPSLKVQELDRFNLFLGRNNVGKTSLLEAFFLLAGAKNPELPFSVNVFRGIQQFRTDPEALWGWLFYKKDLRRDIVLEGDDSKGRQRRLTISVGEPKEMRVRAGAKETDAGRSLTTAVTEGDSSDLILRYRDENGKKSSSRAYVKDNAIIYERQRVPGYPMSVYVTSRVGYTAENPERFSKLEEEGKHEDLIEPLKLLEPRLSRLAVLVTGNGPMLYGDIGMGRMVPIPIMGDGTGRLTTLLLAVASSPGGLVMVDEIDDGFHFGVMKNVWKALITAARRFNTQIVATTHSMEGLKSAHEAFSEMTPYDLKVFRLDRRGETIECLAFDKDMVEMAMKSGLELR